MSTRVGAALTGYDAMWELGGALLISMLTCLVIASGLARGTFLSRKRSSPAERERIPKTRSFNQNRRGMGGRKEDERPPQTQAEPSRRSNEQEHRGQRRRQRQHAEAATYSEENEWWRILEVLPDASEDEIRRSYLRKIHESHPDLLVGSTPEFLELAERRTKALNAAYTEAKRVRRGGSDWIP